MAIYSIATKSFLSRYDQSQPNICVAIPPIATTLAVAKQSVATLFVRSNYIHDSATTSEVVTTN